MKRSWFIALMVLALLAPLGAAQAQRAADDLDVLEEAQDDDGRVKKEKTPGDKKDGEEEEIRKRRKWFKEHRKLDQVDRPGELRRQAVEELKSQIYLEPAAEAVAGSWTSLGPSPMNMMTWAMGRVAGRVSALAVNPSNDSVLYLGTASGGLWKTTDGGTVWSSVFDGVGTQTIGSLAFDPANSSVVWAGTGEQGQDCYDYFGMGLYRSLDAGASWSARNGTGTQTLELSHVTAVAVQPGSSSVVLAGGRGECTGGSPVGSGLYRTTDAGATWTRVLSGSGVDDIIFHPTSPGIVYAAVTNGGVYKSTNGGANWTLLTNGIPSGSSAFRVRLAMAPTNSNVLYALVNRTSSGSTGLYRTLDGGASWTLRNNAACDGQCWYNLSLSVSPSTYDTVLVGAIRIWRSTDGGTTLSVLTTTWGSTQKVHQDTHVVQFSRSSGSKFWVGSDGGLWRTTDSGANFTNLNGNLNITQFYDIAVHPDNAGRVFGGSQDNSSEARSTSAIWDVTVVTGDGFVNAVDPGNVNYVFTESYPNSGGANIYRSTTGGGVNSFSRLPQTGFDLGKGSFPWKTEYTVVQATTNSYLITGSTYMYRANARTSSTSFAWTRISDVLSGSLSAITPANGSSVYIGTTAGRVYRSDNPVTSSPTWVDVTGNLPTGTISDVAVDPNYRWRVFATRSVFGGNKLYRSTSGGTTWTAVGSGLPDVPANAVAIDPVNRQRVFVATDIGVYVSEDDGASFAPQMTGLPLGNVVTDLEVDSSPHVLTAGSYGRGAWQLALPSETATCVPAGGVDDTLSATSCCTGIAVANSTVCNDPADRGTDWITCSHICATPTSGGCIPSGGVDDVLGSTSCCSGSAKPNTTWCLDPADWGTDWVSCVQTCS